MPKMSQTVAPIEQPTVTLAPKIRLALKRKMLEYQSIHAQIKALQKTLDDKKAEIGEIRDDTGEVSIEIDGFRVTLVGGTRRQLNKKKLIALGCAAAWLEEATEEVPTKAYEKITLPGETDKGHEAE